MGFWARTRTLLLVLLVGALAFRAQRALTIDRLILDGVVFYGLAIAAFLVLVRHFSMAAPFENVRSWSTFPGPRRWLLRLSLALGLGSVLFFGDNQFTLIGLGLGLAGLVLLWVGWGGVERPSAGDGASPIADRASQGIPRWEWLILAAITALGLFLRLYRLDDIPGDLFGDINHNFIDVQRILDGERMIFAPTNYGREVLFFYAVALYSSLAGLSFFALKLVAALLGMATIPLMYLVGRYLYNGPIGLLAAFALAVSDWHLIFSRTGYRAVLMPVFVLLTIYFLARAVEQHRTRDFWGLGVILGLGWYAYTSARLLPMIVLAAWVLYALAGRGTLQRHVLRPLGLTALAALIVLVPLGRYVVDDPVPFFQRTQRMVGADGPAVANSLGTFADNYWRSLLMFNYSGDPTARQNPPFVPQLDYFTGMFFVLGLSYCLWRWRQGHNAALIVTLLVTLATSAANIAFPKEVPNAAHALGAIVPATLMAGVGSYALLRRTAEALPRLANATLLPALGFAVAAIIIGQNAVRYFSIYPWHLPAHNYPLNRAIAEVVEDFTLAGGRAYIKLYPFWIDGHAIRFQFRQIDRGWDHVVNTVEPNALPGGGGASDFLFVLNPQDREAVSRLQTTFPKWMLLEHKDDSGQVAFLKFLAQR